MALSLRTAAACICAGVMIASLAAVMTLLMTASANTAATLSATFRESVVTNVKTHLDTLIATIIVSTGSLRDSIELGLLDDPGGGSGGPFPKTSTPKLRKMLLAQLQNIPEIWSFDYFEQYPAQATPLNEYRVWWVERSVANQSQLVWLAPTCPTGGDPEALSLLPTRSNSSNCSNSSAANASSSDRCLEHTWFSMNYSAALGEPLHTRYGRLGAETDFMTGRSPKWYGATPNLVVLKITQDTNQEPFLLLALNADVFYSDGTWRAGLSCLMALKSIGAYLKSVPVGEGGRIAVVHLPDQMVAATSADAPIIRSVLNASGAYTYMPLRLSELDDRVLSSVGERASQERVFETRQANFSLVISGAKYFVSVNALELFTDAKSVFGAGCALRASIFVVVKQDSYMGPLTRRFRTTIIVGVAIVVLAVAVGSGLLYLSLRPLVALRSHMVSVATLQMQPHTSVSSFKEIRDIQCEFDNMCVNLEEYKSYLPSGIAHHSVLLVGESRVSLSTDGELRPAAAAADTPSSFVPVGPQEGGSELAEGRPLQTGAAANNRSGNRAIWNSVDVASIQRPQAVLSVLQQRRRSSLSKPSRVLLGSGHVVSKGLERHLVHRSISYLVAEAVGFDRFAEHSPPGDVVALHSTWLETISTAAENNQGTIGRIDGDHVTITWGIHGAVANHEVRALDAAMEISAAMDGQPELPVTAHIGVVGCARCLVGNIGTETLRTPVVIGPAVVQANFLCAANAEFETKILVNSGIESATWMAYELRVVDVVCVGEGAPQQILTPVGRKQDSQPTNVEWMYQLSPEGTQEAALKLYNDAFIAFTQGRKSEASKALQSYRRSCGPADPHADRLADLLASTPEAMPIRRSNSQSHVLWRRAVRWHLTPYQCENTIVSNLNTSTISAAARLTAELHSDP